MISANRPRLSKITVVEEGFLISGGSPIPEGVPLVNLSPSPPASEGEGEFGSSEEGFRVFEQADLSEDPSGDLGDPTLSEAELSLVGTYSRTRMGLKRKPSTSLLELLEGQPGRNV